MTMRMPRAVSVGPVDGSGSDGPEFGTVATRGAAGFGVAGLAGVWVDGLGFAGVAGLFSAASGFEASVAPFADSVASFSVSIAIGVGVLFFATSDCCLPRYKAPAKKLASKTPITAKSSRLRYTDV